MHFLANIECCPKFLEYALANLFTNKMSIVHEHNTRSKKQLSFEDALEKMDGNILEQISNLKLSP